MSTDRLTLLVLLLAACSNQQTGEQKSTVDTAAVQSAEPSYSGPKACDLLTREEIAKVTGLSLEAADTVTDYAGDSQCRFAVTNDTVAAVMVTLHAEGKIEPYQKVPTSVPVSGLGDAAVWNPGVFQLAAAKGRAIVSVAFLGLPAAKQAWATQLTRTALQRITDASAP